MTDYFELLSHRRRPWLSEDALKLKFAELSMRCHPDRFHNATEEERGAAGRRYAEINAAFQCLREPRDRLRHLLELETGARPRDVETIPANAMGLFFEVAQACRDADSFLGEKTKASSPLVKAKLYERGLEWTDRLAHLQARLQTMRRVMLAELDAMNAVWESAPPPGSPARLPSLPLKRLEEIYRVLSYIARWTGQIQERAVQLSF